MKIQIGKFAIYPLLDGYFSLDRGQMIRQAQFVREKIYDADERDKIRLAARCYLITGNAPTLPLLFDTGVGNPKDPIMKPIGKYSYADFLAIDQSQGDLIFDLRRAGFAPEDIKTVTQSHLHFDHTGWNVFTDKSGKIVPTFPNATYLAHHDEWGEKVWDHPASLKSYRKESFLPIPLGISGSGAISPGHLCLITRSYSLTEGACLIHTGGHTCNRLYG